MVVEGSNAIGTVGKEVTKSRRKPVTQVPRLLLSEEDRAQMVIRWFRGLVAVVTGVHGARKVAPIHRDVFIFKKG